MVGGPVFGPQPRLKQAFFVAVAIVVVAAAVSLVIGLAGCSTHSYMYRPIPAEMIPPVPTLPTVKSSELSCLSDEVYLRLAERDRIRKRYADELRALLGDSDAEQ